MRAIKSPMLLLSILAASSRHQALKDNDWQEASDYHSKCLTLVIQALSRPDHCHNDTLIVTMVFLRLYELFNSQPFSALHLDGLASLLGAIPTCLQSGGLAEASAWLALRHDLFIAMMTKRAPRITLDDYDHSSVFQSRATPGATAYAIILIWAKILRHLYSADTDGPLTTWSNLEHAVEAWYDEKRWESLFQQDANVDPDQPFLIISMSSAPQGDVLPTLLDKTSCIDYWCSHRSSILSHLSSISQLVQTVGITTRHTLCDKERSVPSCDQFNMHYSRHCAFQHLGRGRSLSGPPHSNRM